MCKGAHCSKIKPGCRVLTVVEVEDISQPEPPSRSVKTSMTEDEVQSFLEEWNAKWNPQVDEAMVARAQEGHAHFAPGQEEEGGEPDKANGREEVLEGDQEVVEGQDMEELIVLFRSLTF